MNFIEICAGCGGLSSGLIKSGFIPLLLNDNNKDCCSTLKKNHPNINIIHNSFENLDLTSYINKCDLLVGGIPCQSFSTIGNRKGINDKRGHLIFKFIELISIIKPKLFLIENVKGLLSINKKTTFNQIINNLNELNIYNISYKCLNSFNYNVPQKRERIFIIGYLKSLNKSYEFPNEIPEKKLLKDVLIDVPISNGAKYSDKKIKLFQLLSQGECWINLPIELQKEYLGNSFNSSGGKRGILARLSLNKPSLTLLCSPTQKQTERCHPLEERPLTIREYARIQTFPDDYQFIGSLSSQYKQIGNAVPVELAYHIGLSLKKILI
jgi:DNA (cytosine-5)-methyltransferase 1